VRIVNKFALSVEQSVKAQFARLFTQSDWQLFKRMAEFYLRGATSLRTHDLDAPEGSELLARNSQKRLHIGVAMELLIKAIYLRRGYQINKLIGDRNSRRPEFPYTFQEVEKVPLKVGDTFTLGPLIQSLHKVAPLPSSSAIQRGLKIAMVFRNKEGHAVYERHTFVASNYRDIEACLVAIYAEEFKQVLRVRFSMEEDEKDEWQVDDTTFKQD
jgi:hypothetical protein